eukprot:COSAG02_NODE_290_length_25531_cov_75.132392_18_plen_212_part_00
MPPKPTCKVVKREGQRGARIDPKGCKVRTTIIRSNSSKSDLLYPLCSEPVGAMACTVGVQKEQALQLGGQASNAAAGPRDATGSLTPLVRRGTRPTARASTRHRAARARGRARTRRRDARPRLFVKTGLARITPNLTRRSTAAPAVTRAWVVGREPPQSSFLQQPVQFHSNLHMHIVETIQEFPHGIRDFQGAQLTNPVGALKLFIIRTVP